MAKNITAILKNTQSHIISSIISSGGCVLGVKIDGFSGMLIKNQKFSDSLQKKVEEETGLKGFISTDELPKYGISVGEKIKIEKIFGAKKKDVAVFVAGNKSKTAGAIKIIEETLLKKLKKKKEVKPKLKKRVAPKKKTKKTKKCKR